MEEEKKNNYFFKIVFSTYFLVFLLKFRLGEIVGWKIKLVIQWVPTLHTFDGPSYPKNKKYLKKCDDDGIKFWIQWVPTMHTLDGPCYPKNKKYLKMWWSMFLLKFRSRELVGCDILLMVSATPKTRNTWKNVMMT